MVCTGVGCNRQGGVCGVVYITGGISQGKHNSRGVIGGVCDGTLAWCSGLCLMMCEILPVEKERCFVSCAGEGETRRRFRLYQLSGGVWGSGWVRVILDVVVPGCGMMVGQVAALGGVVL